MLLAALVLAGCGDTTDTTDPGELTTLLAVGDGAVGEGQAVAVADRIAEEGIDRLLYLGDVYENGTLEEFERNYEPVYGRFREFTSPTPGDHEWPTRAEGYDVWWRRALGRKQPYFYSQTIAGWEILSINSEQPVGPASRQYRWLRRQLAENGDCRVLFSHRPRYSAGTRHGDQADLAPVWRLVRGHVRIWIAANDHDMQRLEPRDGIVQFVSGAGGRELYPVRRSDPRLAFSDDDRFGALRLTLTGSAAGHAFVDAEGETLDEGVISCTQLTPPP